MSDLMALVQLAVLTQPFDPFSLLPDAVRRGHETVLAPLPRPPRQQHTIVVLRDSTSFRSRTKGYGHFPAQSSPDKADAVGLIPYLQRRTSFMARNGNHHSTHIFAKSASKSRNLQRSNEARESDDAETS